MTIDAQKPLVNTAYPDAADFRRAGDALETLKITLRKTTPDQFANVLEREWRNRFYDFYAAGTLYAQQIADAILIGAGTRASCLGVADQFCAAHLPQPRSLQQALDALAFTDAGYQPGDEPEELIKRLLPRDGVTMIGGQSGAGKTFALISMALALATGTDLLGHPVRERVGVIIAAAEGAGTIAARLEAAKRHAGITEEIPIGLVRRVPDLKDPAQHATFLEDVRLVARDMTKKYGVRVGVLGIDTVSQAFSIEDEKDNSEAAHICKILAWFGTELQMAIVPVHHFGKSQEQGLRGASAWRANVDHALSIVADRDGATGQVMARTLNVMKSRIGEEGPVCALDLHPVRLGENRYGEAIYSCALVTSDAPAAPPRRRKSSISEQKFVEAYQFICQPDVRRSVGGSGPSVPAVRVEHVETEFMRRYIPAGDSPKKKADAARLAWKRALEAAQTSGAYATENHKGDAWIWDIDAQRLL